MFDKFGEMGSAQEINELAENLKKEGDLDSIRAMAEENGIPKDFADLFIDGVMPCLTDDFTAASSKLDLESKALNLKGLMIDWVEYIRGLCIEKPEMAAAVRAKGKSLKACMAKLLAYSFNNRIPVDEEIVKEAKISASKVDFGVPDMKEARRIIREYYMGGGTK